MSLLIDTLSPSYSWKPYISTSLPSLLSSAGFTSVSTHREKLPLGARAGASLREREVGLYMKYVFEGLVRGVLARWRELGLEEGEAGSLERGVVGELEDQAVGGHLWWTSVWAQRPG